MGTYITLSGPTLRTPTDAIATSLTVAREGEADRLPAGRHALELTPFPCLQNVGVGQGAQRVVPLVAVGDSFYCQHQ